MGANSSAYHGVPIAYNLASNMLVRNFSNNTNASIITANHPFPKTSNEQVLVDTANGLFSAIVLAIGLSFIPAAYVSFIVDEKASMVKHQQLVSGMGITAYWYVSMHLVFLIFLFFL